MALDVITRQLFHLSYWKLDSLKMAHLAYNTKLMSPCRRDNIPNLSCILMNFSLHFAAPKTSSTIGKKQTKWFYIDFTSLFHLVLITFFCKLFCDLLSSNIYASHIIYRIMIDKKGRLSNTSSFSILPLFDHMQWYTLANTRSSHNVVSMLGQRRMRWPNIETTLCQLLITKQTQSFTQCLF